MTEETQSGISRRTLAAGVAWATPAVAVAAAAPAYAASVTTTTTTKPPCVGDVGSTGGTYPVTYALSGCNTSGSHWDFRLTIQADANNCNNCTHLRVTLFDNPKRSRLWIVANGSTQTTLLGGNPSTNANHYNRLYVQKVLALGATGTFPDTGDVVRRVSGPGGASNYTNYVTNPSADAVIGPITAHGTNNDALHVLMNANGTLPCAASGPMAYYKVECGSSANGPWTQLGNIGEINICVPMIQASVCSLGGGRYRLGVSPLVSCGLPANSFTITRVRRNGNTNSPNDGSQVWSGSTSLGPGVTNIETSVGSGSSLWIEFTTDNVNYSWIRVPTSNTSCGQGRQVEVEQVERADEAQADKTGEVQTAPTAEAQPAPTVEPQPTPTVEAPATPEPTDSPAPANE